METHSSISKRGADAERESEGKDRENIKKNYTENRKEGQGQKWMKTVLLWLFSTICVIL